MKYFQLKSSQLASFQINQFFSNRKLGKKNRDREGVRKGGMEKELREKEWRKQRQYFKFLRIPGIDSASLCSLAGRYDSPITTRFLAPIDCSKVLAQKREL
jgi:hypothetical protein